MLQSLHDQLASELEDLRRAGRHRTLPSLSGPSRTHLVRDQAPLISFCSNDYLGLANNPVLLDAAKTTLDASGVGASASRLVSGDFPEHRRLEHTLADFLAVEAAVVFPSGYQANLGAITSLVGPQDLIVADRAVHASILDGCRLSKAKLAVYPHLDLSAASHLLTRYGPSRRRRLLVTESLFSMDGDVPPLPQLADLAHAHDAALYVDEAHAIGLFGPFGRGLCAHHGVTPDILVGTLGKAIGAAGAFVAGSSTLVSTLVNRARSFIFTTALPPSIAAAADAALRLIASPQGDDLRAHLFENAAFLRAHLRQPLSPFPTPIIPIPLHTESAAIAATAALSKRGYFVQAIRPPTVPPGHSMLRLTVSSAHTPNQLAGLLSALDLSLPSPSSPDTQAPSSHPPAAPQAPANPTTASHTRPRPLLICGTDTGVGKTTVTRALLALLTRRGLHPAPLKPVQTGSAGPHDDAHLLRDAANLANLPIHVVCPYSFPDPVSPLVAAKAAGLPLTAQMLLDACRSSAIPGTSGPLLIETAGGLLSPYAPGFSAADLATQLPAPVLLVARDALGTVNHTALAVSELRRRQIPILGILLTRLTADTTPDQASNATLIHQATGIAPLGVLPFLPNATLPVLADALETALGPANLELLLSRL